MAIEKFSILSCSVNWAPAIDTTAPITAAAAMGYIR